MAAFKAHLYFAIRSFYNGLWKDTLWVLGKIGGYFLGVFYFFWGIPGKVYPTLNFLVEGLSSVLDRCDSLGIILHKVIFLLYLPIFLILVWEWYRNHALVVVEVFFILFSFLSLRFLYLLAVTGQLQANQAELWALFSSWMLVQAVSFLSLKDVKDFASKKVARELLFYPKEVLEAEATLLSRSFL